MALIKYRPNRGLSREALSPFGHWGDWDRAVGSMFSDLWKDASAAPCGEVAAFNPPIDVTQDATSITVRAELPGVKKEDVEITFHENTLTLKGSKRMEKAEGDADGKNGGGRYHYVERRYGEFLRTFTLSDSVDTEKAQAEFKDGVLEIRMPILEAAKPRKIEIHSN